MRSIDGERDLRDFPAPAEESSAGDPLRNALWIATTCWVVGVATVFPLGNDALEAVSVFNFDRIGFLVVVALGAVAVYRRPAMLRWWGAVEGWMAVYVGVAVLSWAATVKGKSAVDVKRDLNLLINGLLMPYTAFLVARHCGWTRRQVGTACKVAVVAIGGALVAIGMIQGLIDWRFLVAEVNQGVHRGRIRGPFPNAVPYAALLASLVPVALAIRASEPRRRQRWMLVALCVALLEALVLSKTRVAWAAVPLALLYLAAIARPLRRSALVAGVGLIAAVSLASTGADLRWLANANAAARQPKQSVGERLVDAGPLYNRIAVYATALNMIAHRPLLGFGFGAHTFEESRAPYYTSCCGVSWKYAVECAVPHNEILNVLVLMGGLGLIVYLGLLRALWRLLSAARAAALEAPERALIACVQAAFVALAVTAQLHDVMDLTAIQVTFFFLAGLAAPAAPRDAA